MIEKLKIFGIGFGFFIASAIIGEIYLWLSPYFIKYFYSIILMQDQETLKYLLPSPFIIMLSVWLYITGSYFNKIKMIETAEALFAVSMIIGMLISLLRWFYA